MPIFAKMVAAICGLGIGTSGLSPSAVLCPATNPSAASRAVSFVSIEHRDDIKPGSIHCGYNHLSINVDGTKRKFILFVPAALRIEDKNPVVFVLHGALGDSNSAKWNCQMDSEAEKRKAISPVEGAMEFAGPAPTEPVSVIVFHGKQDKVIRYDGEPGRWLFMRVYAPSVSDCIKYWVKQDQCLDEPAIEVQNDIERQLYKNGKAGTEVCLYTLPEGTHTWPGGKWDHIRHPILSTKFSTAEVMCDFFLAHPKYTSP